ncbi:PepSY-associated TM helix domain-containing protein [Flavobacterium sp. UBA6031]|uniref:PepSY-associated TM helix domain-containing protein n=1 Tax=Flavobacterium sp. UBA6031 TaxID=1946551 RepID=UPI0025C3F6BA|nr:PepSY domain-containing protein [Flavobacterium sp. UBA6031]
MYKFFKKTHKWVGVFIALLVIVFSISGIFLNHRQTFSSVDINRNILPKEYQYNNWNNAAVRATLKVETNRFLVYGNVGIWQTDSNFVNFNNFNAGLPVGIDNRKIFKVLRTDKALLAGTLFGLYKFNPTKKQWTKLRIPVHEENVVDMLQKGDSTFVMTRSNLLVSTNLKQFEIIKLPQPDNYDNKIGLFKTLWVIHSGEIYGIAGKLLVDLVALVFILLSIGGVILFFTKKGLKKSKANKTKRDKLKKTHKWNLKWHNRIGWITGLFLFITTLTGVFLRPPLLIAIANARVGKIPLTELDTPNPWFDVLRRIIFIPDQNIYIVSTADGFYYFDKNFKKEAKSVDPQPPASIMGVTVLESLGKNNLMIGSFEGLFKWNYKTGEVYDLIKKKKYIRPTKIGPPIGDFKISGFSSDFHHQNIAFEYEKGGMNINNGVEFSVMPENVIEKSPMSLWSLALEIHTGRIYGAFLGLFYILVVPLVGIFLLFTLITGIVIWFKYHLKLKRGNKTNKITL